ncbi:hypothetical protein CHELA1G11_14310 [Hyphomicrobiales bacterium]|nr:hypothetical protein CHELA1G2_10003 [Hyphomicrobiales bacterium]CAH1677707.1 hypothetical protein CHELA1G11_14310 [Hyphomicrobiales bacterium]
MPMKHLHRVAQLLKLEVVRYSLSLSRRRAVKSICMNYHFRIRMRRRQIRMPMIAAWPHPARCRSAMGTGTPLGR